MAAMGPVWVGQEWASDGQRVHLDREVVHAAGRMFVARVVAGPGSRSNGTRYLYETELRENWERM